MIFWFVLYHYKMNNKKLLHFLCLTKENEAKEKSLFQMYFLKVNFQKPVKSI